MVGTPRLPEPPLGAGAGTELRLYAVGIDEARGLFGVPEERRDDLRALAREALGLEPPPQRTRMWAALFRHDPHRPVATDPDAPTMADVEAMLAGGHVPPDRNPARWRLAEALVGSLAYGRLVLTASPQLIDATDFSLACLGAPAALGIRSLVDTPAMLPLPPLPGVRVGYVSGTVAAAMARTYAAHAAGITEPERRALADGLGAWLRHYPAWAERAAHLGRPAPDLLTFAVD